MGSPPIPAATVADAAQRLVIRPMRTLWLLSIAHAVNHAQAVILPLIYLQITQDYDVGVETIAFLAAFGSFASGARPAELRVADPAVLAAQPARRRRPAVRRRVRRPGARRRLRRSSRSPTCCRGSAARRSTRSATACWPSSSRRSAAASPSAPTSPAATSGRSSSRSSALPIIAAVGWRGASIVFGVPAILIAIAILLLIRETGTDRAAAVASGRVRQAFGRIAPRPRPALALPDVGPRRRRARARRRQPVRADLPDPGDRPRRGDCPA